MPKNVETKQRPQLDKYQNIPCRKIEQMMWRQPRGNKLYKAFWDGEDGQEEEIREWVKKTYTQVKRSTNKTKQFNENTCCVEVSFTTLFFLITSLDYVMLMRQPRLKEVSFFFPFTPNYLETFWGFAGHHHHHHFLIPVFYCQYLLLLLIYCYCP